MRSPKAFISYAWEGHTHKSWVRELAICLRRDGIEAILDQWEAVPGDLLPKFMETQVRESDFVLIVCTPKYKAKSEARSGGVGYEGDVMTGEVFTGVSRRKFIPILCAGSWVESSPGWLTGAYYIDLTGTSWSEAAYRDLISALHGQREQAPPIGVVPFTHSPVVPEIVAGSRNVAPDLYELGLRWLYENRGHDEWHKFLQNMLRMTPNDPDLRELGLRWLHENRGHHAWHEVWQSMAS
jgi:hypothetical protein